MKELSDPMCPNVVRILLSFIPNQGSPKIKKAHVNYCWGEPDSRTLLNVSKRSVRLVSRKLSKNAHSAGR